MRAKEILDGLRKSYAGFAEAKRTSDELAAKFKAMDINDPEREALREQWLTSVQRIDLAAYTLVGTVQFYIGEHT